MSAERIDAAALRRAPAWDAWQEVRTPETVDEAEAAVALARMKVHALERAAEREADADRAQAFRYSAGRWRDHLDGLVWALEVLRAGESPLHREIAELRGRYVTLMRAVVHCPDAASLIGLLQRRLAANDRAREALAMEVMGLESINEGLRAELDTAQRSLAERNAKVRELKQRVYGGSDV
jgi:chromosome segregation ATPase